jgi:hypothetical protein
MNMISELTWLQAWYILWCDGDWEHSYGVTIESQGTVGWIFSADLSDTALEGQPLKPGEHRRTESDWITWELNGSFFRSFGGVWNLTEMVGIFRDWVQTMDLEPRAVSSVSRFLAETGQTVPENLRELPWLESWHRNRVLQQKQAYVKIETIDNPGWALEVRMTLPPVQAKEFQLRSVPNVARGWLEWKVEDNLFVSYAGPENLIDQIDIFRQLIDPATDV